MGVWDRIRNWGASRPDPIPLAGSLPLRSLAQRERDVSENAILIQERLAALELALEDVGWIQEGQQDARELSREGLREICRRARLLWYKNPLIRRAVLIQTNYVWGQGVTIGTKAEPLQSCVKRFLRDRHNREHLTGHQAHVSLENERQISANLFLALAVHPDTGNVRATPMPFDLIADVIRDDTGRVAYYLAQRPYQDMQGAMVRDALGQLVAIPSWTNYRPDHPAKIQHYDVDPRWHVAHFAMDRPVGALWGCPQIYAAMDWARAYKVFLEKWSALIDTASQFGADLTIDGNQNDVNAARTAFATRYASGVGAMAPDTNPAPVPGAMFIHNKGAKRELTRTSGVVMRADEGRRLLLMVCAALGLPEHYLGDPSTGNLATSKTMERPVELMFVESRLWWAQVFRDLITWAIQRDAEAPDGMIAGATVSENEYGEPILAVAGVDMEDPELIEVSFPSLLEHDVEQQIAAVVSAATMDGKGLAGLLDERTVARLLLVALGVPDVDEQLADMFGPEGERREPIPKTPESDAQASI